MGQTQPGWGQRKIKWIEPHMGTAHFYGPLRLSCKYQDWKESPLREIRIERDGPLKFSNGCFMLVLPPEHDPQTGVCLRQIWVELQGLAGEIMSSVEGGGG